MQNGDRRDSHFVCSACHHDKGDPCKLMSKENLMMPSPLCVATDPVLAMLRDATVLEVMVCARVQPLLHVYRRSSGAVGYKGSSVTLPVDIKFAHALLPVDPRHVPFFVLRRVGSDGQIRDALLRLRVVYALLTYLLQHNRYYKN